MRFNKLYVYVYVVVALMICIALSPVIIAATEDEITVTFDPDGQIDLDISPGILNFGSVQAENSEESIQTITLYNNGTLAMQTTCETNVTTEVGNMECDGDGTPGLDFFSFQLTSTSMDGNNAYISNNTGSPTTLDNSMNPSGSDTFKITIYIGSLSANHTTQTTTVNFTGTIV